MGLIRGADNKHTDIGIVTDKTKKHAEKKQVICSTMVCESTVLVPDLHINAKQIMGEQSLSGVDDVIRRHNTVNDRPTVTPRKIVGKQSETSAKSDCGEEKIPGIKIPRHIRANFADRSAIFHKLETFLKRNKRLDLSMTSAILSP